MLAFDIECEGLNKYSDRITVASVYDPEKNIKRNFNFIVGDTEKNRDEFLQMLDDAEVLASFNGVKFDLPFIIQRFNVPQERYSPWFAKLFDYFEVCRLVFGSSCSLNKLLETNGHEVKTSSGKQAVEWAMQGEWEKLEQYCLDDTILTYRISREAAVVLPLTRKPWVQCHHTLPRQHGGTGEDGTTHSLRFTHSPPIDTQPPPPPPPPPSSSSPTAPLPVQKEKSEGG